MPNRAVILNSGGIDSRVAAAMLTLQSGMEVHSLTVDWNPAARDRVLASAQVTADVYCASHFVFTYPVDWMLWSDRLGKRRMPYTVHAAIALGAQYALHVGTTWLATGGRADSIRDPDNWSSNMQAALNQSKISPELVVLGPVFRMTADEVSAKAAELGVDLTTTWSCAEPEECGTCSSCNRRRSQGL